MKKVIILISVLLIIVGCSILGYSFYLDISYKNEDKKLVQDFLNDYEQDRDNETNKEDYKITKTESNKYLAIIEIPEISLSTGIVMSNESYSTMNRNVSIYPTSDMPDIKNGNFVLFAHNGSSRVAYFKNISKLKSGNEIYIYYNNQKYVYKVINKYNVQMNDNTPLNRITDKTIITLITCKNGNNKYRTIVVGELVQ